MELGLRVAGVTPPRAPRGEEPVTERSQVPGLGFEPRRGARVVLDLTGLRPPGDDQVEQRVNAHGFRGPPLELAREPGRGPRILCLGDSHTFGTGVAEHETWPARLGERLAQRGWPHAQVINAGVPGYDTRQEVIWLHHAGFAARPDVVLLQYFANDVAARGVERPAEAAPGWLVQLAHPRREGWVARLRGLSRAADVTLDALYRRHSMAAHVEQLVRWHAPGDPGAEAVVGSLRYLRDACRERGLPLGVVLYPMVVPAARGDGYASRPALRWIAEACAREGVPVLDAEPALLASGLAPTALRVAPGDLHAGAAAHRLVADAVADWLTGPDSPADLSRWR